MRRPILLVATNWQPRALIRAQLIEEGFDVVAMDDWSAARTWLQSAGKPGLVVLDLAALPRPDEVLEELRGLIDPKRVLVLGTVGSISAADLERAGFRVAKRPLLIKDVVASIADAARESSEF